MDKTSSELRKTENALLRRIQRQMERARAESPIFKNQDFLELEEIEEAVLSLSQPTKKTRLSLFENRKGNR